MGCLADTPYGPMLSGDSLRAVLILSGDVLPSSQNLSCMGRDKLADTVALVTSDGDRLTRYPSLSSYINVLPPGKWARFIVDHHEGWSKWFLQQHAGCVHLTCSLISHGKQAVLRLSSVSKKTGLIQVNRRQLLVLGITPLVRAGRVCLQDGQHPYTPGLYVTPSLACSYTNGRLAIRVGLESVAVQIDLAAMSHQR